MIYAQYRLGKELISSLPADMRRTIGRFRQLYDMGLHGPELMKNSKIQKLSGMVFFERACRLVRMEHSEAALAYLYGLIVHYSLSSRVNPLIRRRSEVLSLPGGKIRTEFDRFLLERDGKKPPHRYDRSMHIRLTPGEQETVAMFYPGVSPRAVGRSVKQLHRAMRLSAITRRSRRDLVKTLLRISGDDLHMMALHPDRNLKSTNAELLELYHQARTVLPDLVSQIQMRLRRKVVLGPDFSQPFA